MRCYVCEQVKIEREAIGICIVCGMGLCSEHIYRSDIQAWEGGYPFPAQRLKVPVPRILCPECYNALQG